MQTIFLATGNADKLAEWRRLLPASVNIEAINVELAEIQSMDSKEIVIDKAKRAYEIVKKPVIIEDVSAGLTSLGGLPGPFIKFFIKAVGEEVLFKLTKSEGEKAVVSCTIAYYDGQKLLSVNGSVNGTVVAARGDNGFGFDKTFVPEGEDKTYAEMSSEEKDRVSHRAVAIREFANQFNLI